MTIEQLKKRYQHLFRPSVRVQTLMQKIDAELERLSENLGFNQGGINSMREDSEKAEVVQNQAMGLAGAECKREKSWDELRDSEKIDRMRDVVKRLEAENGRLRNQIYGVEQKLNLHQHVDGNLSVPLKGVDLLNQSFYGGQKDPIHGKGWF